MINWGIILTLIPGIVYYILSMSIINTINWLVLSLLNQKAETIRFPVLVIATLQPIGYNRSSLFVNMVVIHMEKSYYVATILFGWIILLAIATFSIIAFKMGYFIIDSFLSY